MKLKLLCVIALFFSTNVMAGEPWDTLHSPQKTVKLLTGKDLEAGDFSVEEEAFCDASASTFFEVKRKKVDLIVLDNLHACRVFLVANPKLEPEQIRIKKIHEGLLGQAKIARRKIGVDEKTSLTEVLIDGDDFAGLGKRISCKCAQERKEAGIPLTRLMLEEVTTEGLIIELSPETKVKFALLHCHMVALDTQAIDSEAIVSAVRSAVDHCKILAKKNHAVEALVQEEYSQAK